MQYYRLWIYSCNSILGVTSAIFTVFAAFVLADVRLSLLGSVELYHPTFLYAYIALILQCGVVQTIGCLGAQRLSHKLLSIYWILLLLLTIGDVVVGLVWVYKLMEVKQSLQSNLSSEFKAKYSTDASFTYSWNKVQSQSQCCGVDGPSDHEKFQVYHAAGSSHFSSPSPLVGVGLGKDEPTILILPESCCTFSYLSPQQFTPPTPQYHYPPFQPPSSRGSLNSLNTNNNSNKEQQYQNQGLNDTLQLHSNNSNGIPLNNSNSVDISSLAKFLLANSSSSNNVNNRSNIVESASLTLQSLTNPTEDSITASFNNINTNAISGVRIGHKTRHYSHRKTLQKTNQGHPWSNVENQTGMPSSNDNNNNANNVNIKEKGPAYKVSSSKSLNPSFKHPASSVNDPLPSQSPHPTLQSNEPDSLPISTWTCQHPHHHHQHHHHHNHPHQQHDYSSSSSSTVTPAASTSEENARLMITTTTTTTSTLTEELNNNNKSYSLSMSLSSRLQLDTGYSSNSPVGTSNKKFRVYPQGCRLKLIEWLDHVSGMLFILGFCIIGFVKICFLVILRYEIREMMEKIQLVETEAPLSPSRTGSTNPGNQGSGNQQRKSSGGAGGGPSAISNFSGIVTIKSPQGDGGGMGSSHFCRNDRSASHSQETVNMTLLITTPKAEHVGGIGIGSRNSLDPHPLHPIHPRRHSSGRELHLKQQQQQFGGSFQHDEPSEYCFTDTEDHNVLIRIPNTSTSNIQSTSNPHPHSSSNSYTNTNANNHPNKPVKELSFSSCSSVAVPTYHQNSGSGFHQNVSSENNSDICELLASVEMENFSYEDEEKGGGGQPPNRRNGNNNIKTSNSFTLALLGTAV